MFPLVKIKDFIHANKIFLIVVAVSFVGYSANLYYDYSKNLSTKTYRRLLTSYDITSNTFLPYEIIMNHRIYFGEDTVGAMKRIENIEKPHSVIKIGDKYYSGYPIMAGILAVPFYFVPLVLNKVPTFMYTENLLKILLLGRISASFYTAISVGLFYLILKNLLKKLNLPINKWTYLFVAFYSFGTNTYAIASRGLWQHTSSILFNSLIILFLIYALDNPKFVKWVGLLCGLSFIARPTNIFLVILVTIYVFKKHKKQFPIYTLMGGFMALLLVFYNYSIFGSPFMNEYAARNDTSFTTPILEGLVGYLVSPSRSFLFISPPLVLSYAGCFYYIFKKSKNETEKILMYLSASFLLTLLMLSTWWCWYGADRFGYGFLTEWLPILGITTYLISIRLRRPYKIVLVVLMVYSLYTQVNAVWFRKSRCNKDHIWDFYCITPVTKQQDY